MKHVIAFVVANAACVGVFIGATIECMAEEFTPVGEFHAVHEAFALPLDTSAEEFIRAGEARIVFRVSGKGFAAVVIDSGINESHVSLHQRVLAGHDLTGGRDTLDRYGHGTGIAALIAGQRVPGTPVGDGIAPEACLIPVCVYRNRLDRNVSVDRINEALDWIVQNHERLESAYGVRIGAVNMSLGWMQNQRHIGGFPRATYHRTRQLVRQLRDERILVVVAAGNGFATFNSQQGMDFPAVCDEAISVGAVYDDDVSFRHLPGGMRYLNNNAAVVFAKRGRITAFSQRLSEEELTGSATDIFAPGLDVSSAGPYVDGDSPQSERGSSINDGTSRAAPIVAGAVVLLQQYHQALTGSSSLPPPYLIEECLREGGIEFTDMEETPAEQHDNVVSCGKKFYRLNVFGALEHMRKRFESDVTRARLASADNPGNAVSVEILSETIVVD